MLIWSFILSVGILLLLVAILMLGSLKVDAICVDLPAAVIEGGLFPHIPADHSKTKEKKV